MLEIIAESWAACKALKEKDQQREAEQRREQQAAANATSAKSAKSSKPSGYFRGLLGKKSNKAAGYAPGEREAEGEDGAAGQGRAQQSGAMADIPRTFDEMMKLNAAMTGANFSWIAMVLDSFDKLVETLCKGGDLEVFAHIMAMRFNKDATGKIYLREFQVCMLASLRALLPERWDIAHERAWMSLWERFERDLQQSLPIPRQYERVVHRYVQGLGKDVRREVGLAIWGRMFQRLPHAENFFRQSNQRLIYIVEQGLDLSAQFYQEPSEMVNRVTALGLRHIMWSVPPEYFEVYVECFLEELSSRCQTEADTEAVDGVGWSLCIIAAIMARTIQEGSTPVLRAVVNNDVKALKRELNAAPRGERARMQLYA